MSARRGSGRASFFEPPRREATHRTLILSLISRLISRLIFRLFSCLISRFHLLFLTDSFPASQKRLLRYSAIPGFAEHQQEDRSVTHSVTHSVTRSVTRSVPQAMSQAMTHGITQAVRQATPLSTRSIVRFSTAISLCLLLGLGSAFAASSGTVFRLNAPAVAGGAWTKTILYTFLGGNDGKYPFGELAFDASGNIVSTTQFGGGTVCGTTNPGCGTVFMLKPPASGNGAWTESILYNFTTNGGATGAAQDAGTAIDSAGRLYSTNKFAGQGPCVMASYPTGCGTVFRVDPPAVAGAPWTFNTIHFFLGSPADGRTAKSNVTVDANGNVFGVSQNGGTFDVGMIYELAAPSTQGGAYTENILYTFTGHGDGGMPRAGVLLLSNGNIISTTQNGGAHGSGTVFMLTPPVGGTGAWTESVLYSFGAAGDGKYPIGELLQDAAGNIYGATNLGGSAADGTVWKLAPPTKAGGKWTETILHSFTGMPDGNQPLSGVVADAAGNLYGTTNSGGASNMGSAYQLTPPTVAGGAWGINRLWSFTGGADGNNPGAGVILDGKGNVYGTTAKPNGR